MYIDILRYTLSLSITLPSIFWVVYILKTNVHIKCTPDAFWVSSLAIRRQ